MVDTKKTNTKRETVLVFLIEKDIKKKVGTTTKTLPTKLYSKMPKATADALGIKAEDSSTIKKGERTPPGSKGAGSYKLWFGATTPKGHRKLHSMPIPATITIYDVMVFLNDAKVKKKPTTITTKDGVSYPLLKPVS